MTDKLDKDSVIFGTKSLADVFQDIYNNSTNKQQNIDKLIDTIKQLLTNVTDASLLLPILKEVLDISVKNDEQLVKLAAIIQRLLITNNSPGGSGLEMLMTPEERVQILLTAKNSNGEDIEEKIKKLDEQIKIAKNEVTTGDKQLLLKVGKNEKP